MGPTFVNLVILLQMQMVSGNDFHVFLTMFCCKDTSMQIYANPINLMHSVIPFCC